MLFLNIPKNIDIHLGRNFIQIKGPLGEIKKYKSPKTKFFFCKDTNILYYLNKKKNSSKVLDKKGHFYLSLIYKYILGLTDGYWSILELNGVGFKASVEKNKLILNLGYSHDIIYNIPEGITINIIEKKELFIVVSGNVLQNVKQVAAEIRYLRKPEPYKGKGIKYFNEKINYKGGKRR